MARRQQESCSDRTADWENGLKPGRARDGRVRIVRLELDEPRGIEARLCRRADQSSLTALERIFGHLEKAPAMTSSFCSRYLSKMTLFTKR